MKWGALALTSGAVAVSASDAKVTPVQKVIQLLSGMVEKGKEEKGKEQVQFAAYKQFCDDTKTEKDREIVVNDEKIAQHSANIEKAVATIEKLNQEIADHEADVGTWKGDKSASTKVRTIERGEFEAMQQDYSESVTALEGAIKVLKGERGSGFTEQAAFLQIAHLLSEKQSDKLTAFLQGAGDIDGHANAYENHSQGVIDMLNGLLEKFTEERTNLRSEETASKNAYTLLTQQLTNQIENAEESIAQKTSSRAKNMQVKASNQGGLDDQTASKKDNEAYRAELVATCSTKATDFSARQNLRADELTALEQAVGILSAGNVSGHADKHLPSLVQTSFIQMKSVETKSLNVRDFQAKALAFLNTRAKSLKSKVLMQVAASAGADPFVKVKKLIQDLIMRLQQEANEEAEHKGWCDSELAKNEKDRKRSTTKVESYTADIDSLTSSIATLTQELEDLAAEATALNKALQEATEIRTAENKENTQTITDAKEAQVAVAEATTVLSNFYDKAGKATALLQGPKDDAPEIFDESYTGMQSENGGVMGMLEVIQSDFARLESETDADENKAQAEFDKFSATTTTSLAVNKKSNEFKTAKKQDENQALAIAKDDLENEQKMLDTHLALFEKLKPACISTGVSHEERVAARKEEIQSLKEALEILAGNDV